MLEAIDPSTECPVKNAGFSVTEDELSILCSILNTTPAEIGGAEYDLDANVVDDIIRRFAVGFDPRGLPVRLRPHLKSDDLPYRIHTGCELALMLAGTKPLAYFSGRYPSNPDVEEIPDRLFDPWVAKGHFVKREYIELLRDAAGRGWQRGLGIRIVLYALREQAWRIEAFILLLNTAAKAGWNEGFERMQGSLLGYEEWQNDIFIEEIFRPALRKRMA